MRKHVRMTPLEVRRISQIPQQQSTNCDKAINPAEAMQQDYFIFSEGESLLEIMDHLALI